MPELPEVETVKRGLSRHLLDQTIDWVEIRREGLRFPFPESMGDRLEGLRIIDMTRRAKYLLIHLEGDLTWLCHLGMSGRFTIHETGLPAEPVDSRGGDGHGKHDHVIFSLQNGVAVVYTDHRRFGIMDLLSTADLEQHKLLAHLGPEPLSEEFDGVCLQTALEGKKSPVKTALLDQHNVAGLGNIYVCEALHMTGISPRRKAYTISGQRAERLVVAIKEILLASIDAGGSTLQDFAGVEGDLGYFPASFRVYDREGHDCTTKGCRGVVKRMVQGGRSTFYCSSCQR